MSTVLNEYMMMMMMMKSSNKSKQWSLGFIELFSTA